MRPIRVLLTTVGLCAAAACGTTVPSTSALTSDGLGGPAASQPSPAADGTGAPLASAGGSTSSGTTGGPATGSTRPLSPAGSAASNVPVAVATGPALAANAPISIGIPVIDVAASNAFTGALGKGLQSADAKAEFSQYLANVNAGGGVAGHKLAAVFYVINPSDSQATYEGAACASFTQDHHVAFVIDIGLSPNFLHCVLNHGVHGIVSIGPTYFSNNDARSFPGLVYPDALALDHVQELQAADFTARGFLTPSSKVGIVYLDDPYYARGEKALESALTARGIKVKDRQAVQNVVTTSDASGTVAQAQNVVLKFRSENIDHVLFVETNAWASGGFGLGAASQGYYPKLAFSSDEPLTNVASNLSAQTLAGSIFFGWSPAQDVTDNSGFSAEALSCLAFMRKQGNETASGNQRSGAVGACEGVAYLAAALQGGSSNLQLTREAFLAGAQRMTSYRPFATFGVRARSGALDGVSLIRDGAYIGSCSCFRYTSSARPSFTG